ncbi:chromosome condensation protein CrcB [Streptomyces avermitilis]|uniref:Fluoride-specific ion channel FluC 2 n=2 Tax=Streptomyces avermitilis TaxID=33903 RepID=FLUC2_STRAW|nr:MULTISPECIES: fluoride efflux transporter CrcB [Streptomyces]Q82NI1.1 RecName: Full=Fluoride-specific ion channel FluC 2 [Streptomyces avermitilis MA-4680 = NBRC 14893]KUN55245.1 chromosome condensation protein CrcB [Streptomyces avermitilis]MYS96951.1 fluoride efflux transporter CrcB [Streptomyces sp. SID5469]OOV26653.1 chromosome condensation protein CrcB [Streptomyces avermitilis]BAC69032.1 putative camphor resistance protein CrcB [Streptomyces avermitilis MA-4680 = NBRC 14893]BBJ48971.
MTVPHPESVGEPGIAVRAPARRRSAWHGQAPVVAVVALGGGIGGTARYAAALLWPTQSGGFPWTTFWVNVVGCAVIGVFMVVITDVWPAHRLVRPFFGTGVLGGFTTFSTYAVDIQKLVDAGHPRTALAYLAATLLAALAAVRLAATAARRVLVRRRR